MHWEGADDILYIYIYIISFFFLISATTSAVLIATRFRLLFSGNI